MILSVKGNVKHVTVMTIFMYYIGTSSSQLCTILPIIQLNS